MLTEETLVNSMVGKMRDPGNEVHSDAARVKLCSFFVNLPLASGLIVNCNAINWQHNSLPRFGLCQGMRVRSAGFRQYPESLSKGMKSNSIKLMICCVSESNF